MRMVTVAQIADSAFSAAVPPGAYYVRLMSSASSWLLTGVTMNGIDHLAAPIEVDNAPVNLEVTIASSGAAIVGSAKEHARAVDELGLRASA